MDRCQHEPGWKPKPGQPFYFQFWDRCSSCGHLQHHEAAKVFIAAPAGADRHRDLKPWQVEAWRALKAACPGTSAKARRQWLAAELGIEERYAIVGDMDEVECRTVVDICAEEKRGRSRMQAAQV